MKIVLLPLDERPCNLTFPAILPKAGFELVLPPRELLGFKKRPADRDKLAEWLLSQTADCFILAMDQLFYGGLIPSRLHGETAEAIEKRADVARKLRARVPGAKIYAFQTIMRCPPYSLSEEEPDYYADCGADLCLVGKYRHKEAAGVLTEKERVDFERAKRAVPEEALSDYLARREINLRVLLSAIRLREEGILDELVVAQDDSAPYGFTALDQAKVRAALAEKRLLMRVPVYPAADDTGMTLLLRAVNEARGVSPKVFVLYASARGPLVVPCFEDRTLDATVCNQIRAAGCTRVFSLPECDILLAVNVGDGMPREGTKEELSRAYDVERSLPAFVDGIEYALAQGKRVAVADVAYPSNSDLELVRLLHDEDLLFAVSAYAGWNTSSNTIGTVLAEAGLCLAGGDEAANRYFLLHRYYDDVGYCSHARTFVDVTAVPENGCTVFVLDGERGKCAAAARKELLRYMAAEFPKLAALVKDVDVSYPWNRTFEIELKLELRP